MRLAPALSGLLIAICAGPATAATDANLASQLIAKVSQCWQLPSHYDPGPTKLTLHMLFARDGTLRDVEIAKVDPDTDETRSLAAAAARALRACSPFKDLPPDEYDDWKSVWVNFMPEAKR